MKLTEFYAPQPAKQNPPKSAWSGPALVFVSGQVWQAVDSELLLFPSWL